MGVYILFATKIDTFLISCKFRIRTKQNKVVTLIVLLEIHNFAKKSLICS